MLNARKRSLINKIRADYSGYVIEESNLRSEIAVANNTPQYAFQILQGDKSPSIVERLLNKNDLFIVMALGLFIYERTDANPGAAELQSFPNESHFTTTAGFTKRHLNVFYNGLLSLSIGTVAYNSGWDTRRFKQIPQTQQSAATNYSQQDEDTGMIDLEPLLKISGANDNKFVASLPYFTGIQVANTGTGLTTMYSLNMRGLLVKGGAQAALKK